VPPTGSPGRKLILLALQAAAEPLNAAELAPLTELAPAEAAVLLCELAVAGLVIPDGLGRYTPTTPTAAPPREYSRQDVEPDGLPLPAGVAGYPVGAAHPRRHRDAYPNAAAGRYAPPAANPAGRAGTLVGGA
jgi:hypothetical protein